MTSTKRAGARASLLTSSHKYLTTSLHSSFFSLQSTTTVCDFTLPITSNVRRNAQDVTNNKRNPVKSQEDGSSYAREVPQRHLTPPFPPHYLTILRTDGQSGSNRRQRRLHRRALLLRHGQRTSRLRYGTPLHLPYPPSLH